MTARQSKALRTLVIVATAAQLTLSGCASDADEYGILGPLQQSDQALSSSGTRSPGLSSPGFSSCISE